VESPFPAEGSLIPAEEQEAPRIAIVGADSLFVDAVSPRLESLGMRVESSNGVVDDQALAEKAPDLILLDADGEEPDRSGTVVRELPNTKRILMSSRLDESGVRAAIRQGFHGAISKDIPIHRFQSAILSVLDGDVVVEVKPVRHTWLSDDEEMARVLSIALTDREREVLALLVEGLSGQDMAERLSVSPHTVRTHVQNVMSKLQVHSRVEAASFAVRHGIVQPDSIARSAADG
jgi:two-component system nitrate/nitrite response regulator NarL